MLGVLLALATWIALGLPYGPQLHELPAQPLKSLKVTSAERVEILSLLEPSPRRGRWSAAVKNARLVRTSLAPGERDLLLQAADEQNCGVTGNCAFWILRESGRRFQVLLAAPGVQQFAVTRFASHGHRSVAAYGTGGAFTGTLSLFAFNGYRYVKQRCADETFSDPPAGKAFRAPQVRDSPC